jgi:hypothetical protein
MSTNPLDLRNSIFDYRNSRGVVRELVDGRVIDWINRSPLNRVILNAVSALGVQIDFDNPNGAGSAQYNPVTNRISFGSGFAENPQRLALVLAQEGHHAILQELGRQAARLALTQGMSGFQEYLRISFNMVEAGGSLAEGIVGHQMVASMTAEERLDFLPYFNAARLGYNEGASVYTQYMGSNPDPLNFNSNFPQMMADLGRQNAGSSPSVGVPAGSNLAAREWTYTHYYLRSYAATMQQTMTGNETSFSMNINGVEHSVSIAPDSETGAAPTAWNYLTAFADLIEGRHPGSRGSLFGLYRTGEREPRTMVGGSVSSRSAIIDKLDSGADVIKIAIEGNGNQNVEIISYMRDGSGSVQNIKMSDGIIYELNSHISDGNGNIIFKSDDACFLSGTKITMSDGCKKNIENICVGDFVLGFDARMEGGLGKLTRARVARISRNFSRTIADLRGLRMTAGHLCLTDGGRFMTIGAILAQDRALIDQNSRALRARTGAIIGSPQDAVLRVFYRASDEAQEVVAEVRAGIPCLPRIAANGKPEVLSLYQALADRGFIVHPDGRIEGPSSSLSDACDWPAGSTPFDTEAQRNWIVRTGDGAFYIPCWIQELLELAEAEEAERVNQVRTQRAKIILQGSGFRPYLIGSLMEGWRH